MIMCKLHPNSFLSAAQMFHCKSEPLAGEAVMYCMDCIWRSCQSGRLFVPSASAYMLSGPLGFDGVGVGGIMCGVFAPPMHNCVEKMVTALPTPASPSTGDSNANPMHDICLSTAGTSSEPAPSQSKKDAPQLIPGQPNLKLHK